MCQQANRRVVTKRRPIAPPAPQRKRVAAYARVSSGKDAMLHSLSSQISYYTDYIRRHREWVFTEVYADEAFTGTKDARPDFQRLLDDCRNGKIDMVITKSIARFARNTLTLLETVRELKSLGIDTWFEQENIHSLSGDGELLLTILASCAQEMSRSVSDNCKWRIRKRFAAGELVGLNLMFGYDIKKGAVAVNDEQAAIVRMIFEDYIGGMGCRLIAGKLRRLRVVLPRNGVWNHNRVMAILQNEKYTGNALLQKKYVEDHLTKKEVRNKGKLPQYYAEDTHPAIIDMETFEMAQEIMEQRRQRFGSRTDVTPPRYPLTGKIICGNCGKRYRRIKAADAWRWQCATYLCHGKAACHAKQIPENILHAKIAEALEQDVFDEAAFEERIAEIRVPEANRLIFVFKDGRTVETTWTDRSRAESWTDEMKQDARKRAREING